MASVVQPAGNFYDKYQTRNPIARRLMQGFLQNFAELVDMTGPASGALEVGCGEGELSIRLARRGWQVKGFDIAEEAVDEARRRAASANLNIPFEQRDIRELRGMIDPVELVVCCEVLEHLENPAEALAILCGLSRKWLLVSVPREPVWRLLNISRGRYWRDFGNTPGHIQHWSCKRFLALLSEQTEVIAARSPLPWTMVLCRPKHG